MSAVMCEERPAMKPRSASALYGSVRGINVELKDEILRFAEQKKKMTMPDEEEWKESIRRQMEADINRRVREALETPPPERAAKQLQKKRREQQRRQLEQEQQRKVKEHLDQLNAHIDLNLTDKEREYVQSQRWKTEHAQKRFRRYMTQLDFTRNLPSSMSHGYSPGSLQATECTNDPYPGMFGLHSADSSVKNYSYYARISDKAQSSYGKLSLAERHEFFYAFTRNGFKEAMRTGRLPDGSELEETDDGKYTDKFGIVRDQHGPFWPADFGPLFPAPSLRRLPHCQPEPLSYDLPNTTTQTCDNQETPYTARWRGVQIVYDSERSSKDYEPSPVSEGHCPSLSFESRFECGNLRQARRVGQFEYELVLKTDLYTKRHTQWYYFRVSNAVPGVTYKFKIVNLLKKNSLYNYGMRPLLYSEKLAATQGVGWVRSGHHISYSRNVTNLHCPLLHREMAYYMLEWQMEFPNADDTYYLAHCYPYTYTDLKDDLDSILAHPERSRVTKREVMCETRAGNSCFLVTVTNFDVDSSQKKGVVCTARVHPGESQSSWMMKGLLDYITSDNPTAKELRNKFIFKIVPMLNPDGVIVGNYRCSLAGRDLNRNYRHPRKESFPTVWHTKHMMEDFSNRNEIMVYCDLHGHSRKSNVFMYGCNSPPQVPNGGTATETFLKERLFPWLMAQKAPDKFSFNGCKFQIKKCKESTGRVVMFRQMQIHNSFTMEATFSGSTICKGDKRHFNLADFQEIGKVFGEVALEYKHMQENKAAQSEVVIDLTRAITHQILQARGMLPANLPDFNAQVNATRTNGSRDDRRMSSSEQLTAAICAMAARDGNQSRASMPEKGHAYSREGASRQEAQLRQKAKDLSRMDVNNLLDNMSVRTIDGCIRLLEQLNVSDACLESDSSDSDSESEPEMKYSDQNSGRKKKKKKRKSKTDLFEKRQPDKDTPDTTKNRNSAALPAISQTGSAEGNKKNGSMNTYVKKMAKTYPSYVNRYQGRSNGGIPCFAEERSMERAAKVSRKMEAMQKRLEEEKQRHNAMYYNDAESLNIMLGYPPNWNLHHSQTLLDLRPHGSGDMQMKGPNIRTGYTHADGSSPELTPGIQHLHPSIGSYGNPSQHPYTDMPDDSSSGSDDEELMEEETPEGVDSPPRPMPLPALNSPYQNVATHMNGCVQPFMSPQHRAFRPQQSGNSSSKHDRQDRQQPQQPAPPHLQQQQPILGPGKSLLVTNSASRKASPGEDQGQGEGHKPQSHKVANMPSVRPVHRGGLLSLPLHHRPEKENNAAMTKEYTEFILERLKYRNSQGAAFTREVTSVRPVNQKNTAAADS